MYTYAVASRGFGSAASLSMFQVRVQECSTQTKSALTCVDPIAWSSLHVDDKVVRRQDTPRTCVQVMEPFVRDVCVAQILHSRHLLPQACRVSCKRRNLVLSDSWTVVLATGYV